MAIPPTLKRFTAEDFDDMPESFVDAFLPTFNDFATATVNALSGALTPGENINSYVEKDVRVPTAAAPPLVSTMLVANRLGRRPECVTVATYSVVSGATPTAAVGVRWEMSGDGRIKLLDFPGLEASSDYKVSLKVE